MTASSTDQLFVKTSENTSAGGVNNGVPITDTRNSFMPAITDAERIAGGSRIKKFCVINNHATDDWTLPNYWVTPADDVTEEFGLGLDHGDDDDSAQGNMDPFTGDDVVAIISDGTDTRTVTVVGYDASGDPQTEDIVLTAAVEALGLLTFSDVVASSISATDGSRTVLIKQGSGGSTVGTIGPTFKCCWQWIEANDQGSSIRLANLAAQFAYCFWWRQSWTAGVAGHRPDVSTLFTIDS